MKVRIITAMVALALLTAIALSLVNYQATASLTPPVIKRDIIYVPGSEDPFQTMDLYLPTHVVGRRPVILWIHGGAWLTGDKNHPPAEPLVQAGFAVASINYRLSTRAPFPAQIYDCKAAVRYLRAHASEYNLDPGRVGAWGHSAGGHLVALLATTGDINALEGNLGNLKFPSTIQAACNWSGPCDLTTIASQAGPDCKIDFKASGNVVEVLLGPHRVKDAAWKASPIAYLSQGDSPMLVIHGEADNVVPVEQSKELNSLTKKLGVANQECIIVPNEGHSIGPSSLAPTVDFFKRYLNP